VEEEAMYHPSFPQKSFPQKSFRRAAGLLVGLSLSLSPLPALADDQQTWSPEFLSALEVWQSRYADMTFADFISSDHPDILTEWVFQASSAMGGSILASYEDTHPALVQVYRETYLELDADGNAEGDDASFVDFLIHGTNDEAFPALEREVEQRDGIALQQFAKSVDKTIGAQFDALPADEPVHNEPLSTFIVQNYTNPLLHEEAIVYEGQASTASVCTCTVLAAASGPHDDTQSIYRKYKPNGTLKEEKSWWLSKRGAARRLFTDRFIRDGLNELYLQSSHNASAFIQFTMSCTRNVNGGMVQCAAGQGCSAALKLDAHYDTHMWVKNEAQRAFPLQTISSSVTATDLYTLVANPGSSGQVQLAAKSLTVERNFNATVSAQSFLQGLVSAHNIYGQVNNYVSGNSNFGTLLNELNDEDINNVLNIATFNGDRGETTLGFASSYTNAGGAPMILANGGTHKIEMDSYSTSLSRGHGHTSRGRSLVASNYYLAGAVTNYTCNAATAPAGPKVAWSYGGVYQAPYSAGAMRQNVDAFIQGTTGLVLNTHAHNGTN
jgi:hypothetical protein